MAHIDIRRASLKDVNDLISIHRECFPEEVLYQVPKSYAKRWWSFLLTFDSVETYVASVNGKTAGSATLKIDAPAYQREKTRHKAPFLIRVYTVVARPKIVIEFYRKFLRRLISMSNDTTPPQHNCEYTSNCAWIDPTAISGKYRRIGLARQLTIFMERRALELNRKYLVTMVAINNKPSMKLHEKIGYERTHHVADAYFFYKKKLNPK